jgi:3D (Asp-Asp-Asp) domain-containing protein
MRTKYTKSWIMIAVFFIILFFLLVGAFLEDLHHWQYQKQFQNIQPSERILIKPTETIEMNASGYSIGLPYSSATKSGHSVVSLGYLKIGDENIFTVAADRRVLPLGSLIYIDSLGIGMVQDTGSKIKGNDLDICFQTMNQAKQFGKIKVKVVLLRKGEQ